MKVIKWYPCFLLLIILVVCSGCNNAKPITVIWPKYLVNMMGYSAEQQVELFQESNKDDKYASDVYANDDGSITFKMNKEQLKNSENKFTDNLTTNIEIAKEYGIIVTISDNKEVIYRCSSEIEVSDFIKVYVATVSTVITLKMISGEDSDDWNLQIKVIDENTGRIIKEGTIPEEEIRILPEDWEE